MSYGDKSNTGLVRKLCIEKSSEINVVEVLEGREWQRERNFQYSLEYTSYITLSKLPNVGNNYIQRWEKTVLYTQTGLGKEPVHTSCIGKTHHSMDTGWSTQKGLTSVVIIDPRLSPTMALPNTSYVPLYFPLETPITCILISLSCLQLADALFIFKSLSCLCFILTITILHFIMFCLNCTNLL